MVTISCLIVLSISNKNINVQCKCSGFLFATYFCCIFFMQENIYIKHFEGDLVKGQCILSLRRS